MGRLLQNKNLVVGASILFFLVFLAVCAPFIAPFDPVKDADLQNALQAPGKAFKMGTDPYGRDLLSRILYGSRISLTIGLVAQAINTIIGVSLGLLAGYSGGWIDDVISGFTNIMLSMPTLIFALAIMVVLGPGIINLYIALGLIGWTFTCRVTRAETLAVKQRLFTEAARVQGSSHFRITTRHILPNILGPIIVIATLGIADAILTAATLGFLGLGVQPPTPEWGAMLSRGRNYIWSAPWLCIFPGLAITLSVLGLNLLGDGIRDWIDPHMRRNL